MKTGSVDHLANIPTFTVKIDLQNIGTVKQEDNWNDLVLPPGHKEMVQAMVESFTRTGSAIANTGDQDDYDVDLVPGKGSSLQ